ncbi:MAG: hypothetical protein HYU77_06020 [Betaproteobacteria bacterium]|nr:hypothetical protein [Betaproteobacteria bacterium]
MLAEAYRQHPHLGPVLPALGYSPAQVQELEQSINRVPCDAVLLGTPADLARVLKIGKPVARARFEARDVSTPALIGRVLPYLGPR